MAAIVLLRWVLALVGIAALPLEPLTVLSEEAEDSNPTSRYFKGAVGGAGGEGGGAVARHAGKGKAATEETPLLPGGGGVEGVRAKPSKEDDRAPPRLPAGWRALRRVAHVPSCRLVLDRQRAVLAGDVCDHEAHDGVRGHAVHVEHVVAARPRLLLRDVHDAHVLRLLRLPEQGHAHRGALPARPLPRLGALCDCERVLRMDRQRLDAHAGHVHQRAQLAGGLLVPLLLDPVAPAAPLHLRDAAARGAHRLLHALLVLRLLARCAALPAPQRR